MVQNRKKITYPNKILHILKKITKPNNKNTTKFREREREFVEVFLQIIPHLSTRDNKAGNISSGKEGK